MGALINFSYTGCTITIRPSATASFVAPTSRGTRSPDWPCIEYDEATALGRRSTAHCSGGRTPDLEFYAEGLWQGFRHEIQDRHFEQPLWGGQTYTNIATRPGTDLVESGTVFNPSPRRRLAGRYVTTRRTRISLPPAAATTPGRCASPPILARTNSTFTGSTESVDYRLCPSVPGNNDPFNCGQTVNFTIGAPGAIPSFQLVNFDPADPNNYAFRGLFEENQQAKGKDWQGRLDFEYQTGSSFLPKLQWGVRYVDRDASRFYGSRYSRDAVTRLPGFPDVYGTPITQVPLDYELFQPGFVGADHPSLPDYLAGADLLRAFVTTSSPCASSLAS